MAMPREVKFSTGFPAAKTRSEVKKCTKVIYYEVRATGQKKWQVHKVDKIKMQNTRKW